MKLKTLLCALLAVILPLTAYGCAKTQTNVTEPATAAPITLPPVQKPTENSEPASQGAEEDPETEPFEYDDDLAVYLGVLNSPIYGKLRLYCQDDVLVIFDAYDEQLFLTSSHGYVPAPFEEEDRDPDAPELLICEDINFDGDLDFRLFSTTGGLNDYYDCWLWNAELRNFEYFRPLSSIPNVQLDPAQQKVISYNRLNRQNAIVTEYMWQGSELLPVGHREVNNGSETYLGGPEDVDTPLAILDGYVVSQVALAGNADSDSKWFCRIENENIVRLYDESYNNVNREYCFAFIGVQPGTTTVLLKYATSWDAAYIATKILNITVRSDMTLRIIETE